MATKVLEYELTDEFPNIVFEERFKDYRILIRLNNQPIGWVRNTCPPSRNVTQAQLKEAITQQLGVQLWHQAQHNSLKRGLSQPPAEKTTEAAGISVIVCTRNRASYLTTCLGSLLALDYPTFEIIIVDNAPSNNETFELVKNMPVRYVLEKRPGLDWARNRGVAEARHNIVAFTDDDAQVDRLWLQAIANAFRDDAIAGVTGLVAPAELETRAQRIFEIGYGGMGHGFQKRTFTRLNLSDRKLLRAGSIGIGVNMAFRREALLRGGQFDVALDVGTPSHGAGDVELFHRLMALGYTLVYDPNMLVWHTHRRQLDETEKQIEANGRSFGCYLITCSRNKTVKSTAILQFLLIDWLYKWILKNLLKPPHCLPRRFSLIEFKGMLKSPVAYRKAQAEARKIIANCKTPSTFSNANKAL
ncbi:glycosyltransferase family 2 protein [Pontibacter sp. CAU 1760]